MPKSGSGWKVNAVNEPGDAAKQPARGPFGLAQHPLMPRLLGEIHARPFQLVTAPRTIIRLAFLLVGGDFAADLRELAQLEERRGKPRPAGDIRHLSLDVAGGRLRWERHTEFTTWTFDAPATATLEAKLRSHPFGEGFTQPGQLIAAIRLDLVAAEQPEAALAIFDPTSLCYSEVEGGQALAVTDFRQDGEGFTHVVVLDRGLGPARAGALTQRLIEVETYRTLALLGLPEAQRLAASLGRIESELVRITAALNKTPTESAKLLDELIALSAQLEADSVATLYRFGASRAYYEIVRQRLDVLHEAPMPGYETWRDFLSRRLGPAMRTCETVSQRQEALSEKLSRAADLLRTRVDVELEQGNRDLLSSMDRRGKLQLRLQRTVEGLSVAAVSYYVVGLISYLMHGAQAAGSRADPDFVAAAAVPVVVVAIWFLVRRIRRRHHDA